MLPTRWLPVRGAIRRGGGDVCRRLGACLAAWAIVSQAAAAEVPVRLQVVEGEPSRPVAARVELRDAEGRPVQPPGLPFWNGAFAIAGEVELRLSPGSYTCRIARGPEYAVVTNNFTVAAGQDLHLIHHLHRLADLAAEGWWSGETHVHRPLAEVELLMQAADLHLAGVQTWWNEGNPWARRPLPQETVVRFDGNRFYDLMSGEDERGGGALLFFGLREPVPITGSQREFPPSTQFLRAAKAEAGGWADIEKPFWWDVPIWLATGLADSMGIAQNHMQIGGVLDNEAWGKPRDRDRYPGLQGNGYWTQDIYYHVLNCGLRLPPTAGSASGVLGNPVGYNRVYVHLDGEMTPAAWWAGLRAGRAFVSNGPLLRCRAADQLPGHVFQGAGPIRIRLEGRLDSRDPIAGVELVQNGRVETISLPHEFTVTESGWFLVRARAEVPATFRFASTAPWYVEIDEPQRPVRLASARFFLDWVRERQAAVTAALTNPAQRDAALEPVRAAEEFWQAKVAVAQPATIVTGTVVDAATGRPLPSRVYVQRAGGRWYFPESASLAGSAVRYERRNWINPEAVEQHTTLSAHPFRVTLRPGTYTFTVERGKEYRQLTREVTVGREPLDLRFPLQRWINLAERGWYSGDTHVHRSLAELPNVMLAEDLNVAFPLTYWVTQAFAPPTRGDKNTDAGAPARLIAVDATHVIWPRNTEYEIFTVGGKRHTLGAVFALNHQTPFQKGAPPVVPVAGQAKLEGALLDLDKHDWPWSMALVPLMGVDLYELANNHHWRTAFGITNWSTPAPAWMELPHDGHGSELDWTHYTFHNYYALLNCGLRLRPTAGTASGVHPVPLGFGRVYVHLPGGFRYESWIKRLNEGRSFVTTGPMLLAKFDQQLPGFTFTARPGRARRIRVEGVVFSEQPVSAVEVILNGRVAERFTPAGHTNPDGAFEAAFNTRVELAGSGWVALRCWEPRGDGRMRFAHTAPSYFDVPGQPLKPPKAGINFLVDRVRDEIERSRGVLPPEAIAEYERALKIYEDIQKRAE